MESELSIKIMTRVWDDAPFTGATLLVLLALADGANDEGRCWPSVRTLTHKARCSERTTYRALDELEAAKWLTRTARDGRSTMYEVTPLSTPDILTGVTPCQGGSEQDVTHNRNEPSTAAAAVDVSPDQQQPDHENDLSRGVTPRILPTVEVRKLIGWFNVTNPEQQQAWSEAWQVAETIEQDEDAYYDPEAHLAIYLGRCREENRKPRSDLWLRFFIEDRAKHVQTLRLEADKADRREEDPQQREDRHNRALPPQGWGITDGGEA